MQPVSSTPDREFEHMETVDNPLQPGGRKLVLLVAKMGGGTMERAYAGRWLYRVRRAGSTGPHGVLAEGDDLNTPNPKTHREALRLLEDFLPDLLSSRD